MSHQVSSHSRKSLRPDGQIPRVRVAHARAAKSFGDLASELAADYGLVPDEWQELVLEDWLSADRSDKWKYLNCGLTVPRQNGKNALLEIRELFGMVGLGETILHSAHEVKTAQAHFRRFKYFFGEKANDPSAKFPDLNAMVDHVRNVNGQEAIVLKSDPERGFKGGVLRVIARSKSSGRGFTADVLVIDEAQELTEDALEALLPTTSAAPTGNPQWIYTGTVPGPNASGEIFSRMRATAQGDTPGAMCWHEWSPDPDRKVDLDNRDLWAETNPALHAGRLQERVILAERKTMSDEGFARERLGLWPAHAGATRAIDPTTWTKTIAEPPTNGVYCFAVAFSADGKRQALAGAVRDGTPTQGRIHINVIDTHTGTTGDGVTRVADWLAERKERAAHINLIGGAGAAALADALAQRGVPARMVQILTTAQYLDACSITFEGLLAGTITHPEGDPEDALNASVAVCDKQKRRRDGAWGWEATTSTGDETPLEAASAAVLAAKTTKRRPGRKAKALS